MKTQIIRLELHDDFISARDKMGWNQTGRVLLVWPENSRVLNRRLDLILLQRHSKTLGAQLALVTNDADVKYHAYNLGIPVYRTVNSAQKDHWRVDRGRKRNPAPLQPPNGPPPDLAELRQAAHPGIPKLLTQPGTRLALFALAVLAFLSIAAVMVPAAKLSLTPETRTQEVILSVQARPDIDAVNYSGSIPAREVTAQVEGRASAASLGSTRVPLEYATGYVRFTNITDSPVSIPVNLIVRTLDEPSIRFSTTEGADLSAGVGISTTLPVEALEAGAAGNLEPNSLVAIEGEMGASLTATNLSATRGGTDSTLSIATKFNREQLYQRLESDLRETAVEELNQQLPAGDILFTPTITISKIIEERYDPAEYLPSDQISINLRIEYRALSAAQEDFQLLARYALDANLPEDYVAVPDSLVIDHLTNPRVGESGFASWRMRVARQVRAGVLTSRAINMTLGMPPSLAARRLFSNLPLAKEPTIEITPRWWPRLPLIPSRIVVTAGD